MNSVLYATAATHPNLEILDWRSVRRMHPEWLAGDCVHLDGAGYAAAKVTTAKNLNDGLAAMKGIVRAGDVVLFENDLPDLYEE